jgi:hypothetical protein
MRRRDIRAQRQQVRSLKASGELLDVPPPQPAPRQVQPVRGQTPPAKRGRP